MCWFCWLHWFSLEVGCVRGSAVDLGARPKRKIEPVAPSVKWFAPTPSILKRGFHLKPRLPKARARRKARLTLSSKNVLSLQACSVSTTWKINCRTRRQREVSKDQHIMIASDFEIGWGSVVCSWSPNILSFEMMHRLGAARFKSFEFLVTCFVGKVLWRVAR